MSSPTYPLIGLCGYARVGKDTVAQVLVERYGYKQIAFADKLRELAWKIHPKYAEYVKVHGYEAAKQQWPRALRNDLVRLGAGVREVLGADVWLDAALPALDRVLSLDWLSATLGGPTVVSDVRYPNEARRIRDLGGVVWKIRRPGVGPANDEEASTITEITAEGLVDFRIGNNTTIEGLAKQVAFGLERHSR